MRWEPKRGCEQPTDEHLRSKNLPALAVGECQFENLLLTDESLTKFVEYSSKVDEEIISDFFIVRNVEEAISKIEEFRRAGVRHLMIINVGPDPKFVNKVYSEKIIPAFAENR